MTTWRYALGITLFLIALYVVFASGFSGYKSQKIPAEWEGCYRSQKAGTLHIADGYMVLPKLSSAKIRISRSQDNHGDFLILDPSFYFDRDTEEGGYTPQIGASNLKGLRIKNSKMGMTIATYSKSGDLIEFVRVECD